MIQYRIRFWDFTDWNYLTLEGDEDEGQEQAEALVDTALGASPTARAEKLVDGEWEEL